MSKAADDFTRDKLAWLEAVQDDPAPPGIAKATILAVAFGIARALNRQKGYAFPKQKLLSQRAGVLPRQVRNVIRHLESIRRLTVESGGFQAPDLYRIIPPERQPTAALRLAMDCHTGDGPERQWTAAQSGNGLPPNPMREPFELGVGVPPTRLFERLVAVFPGRQADPQTPAQLARDHKRARPMLSRILASGSATAEEIIAGAQLYATSAKVARGYAENLSTWLSRQGWRDGPEPPAPATAFSKRRQPDVDAFDVVKEILING